MRAAGIREIGDAVELPEALARVGHGAPGSAVVLQPGSVTGAGG